MDDLYYTRENQAKENAERTALAVTVLIAGLGIGVVLALLFAPADGKKTRRELERDAKRFERDFSRRAKPVLNDVRETGEDVLESVKDTLEKARRAIDRVVN